MPAIWHIWEKAKTGNEKTEEEREHIDLILRGKVVWNDKYGLDLLRYYCNNHPLVSIWAADPMHPFDRRERFIVFLCSIMMSFFVSGMTESIKSGMREDCRDDHGDTGSAYDDCVLESKYIGYAWSMLFGVIVYLYNTGLKQAATCGWAQDESVQVETLAELCGRCCMGIYFVISLGFLIAGWVVAYSIDDVTIGEFVVGFLISQATSILVWGVVLGFLFFNYYRYRELHGDTNNPRHPRHDKEAVRAALPEDTHDHESDPYLEHENRSFLEKVAHSLDAKGGGTGAAFDPDALEMGPSKQSMY